MTSATGIDTLAGIVQGRNSHVSVQGRRRADEDFIVLGELSGEGSEEPLPIQLELEAEVISQLNFTSPMNDPSTVQFSADGDDVPFRFLNYQANDVDQSVRIHSGRCIDDRNDFHSTFGIVSDPVHIPVVAGLVLIVGCPLMSGATFLSEWVQARTSGWRDACKSEGLFPFVVPVFSLRVRGWKLDVECQAKARVECRDLSGRPIHVHETEFVPVSR